VGADGADPHAAGLEGTDPAFAPDGGRLAFHALAGDPAGLVTTALDGSDRRGLGDFDEPDWSPDGATIAASGGDSDIWAVPADGGEPQQLTSGPASDAQPSWSPDGTLVAFTRDSSIAVTDAAGSEPIVLTEGFGPVWSPDGTTIAFTRDVAGQPQVWAIGADGSGERPLIRDAAVEAWQPAAEALPLPEPLPDPGPAPGPPEPPTGNHKPRCSSVRQSVRQLPWRPDHRLFPVRLAGGRDPDGDRVSLRVTWIAQDERVTSRREDRTAPDARRTRSSRVVLLRNERVRRGDGRVYYVEFRLTDEWGRHCTGARYVQVRRWKHRPAVAQKARFPSVRG
jgi:hypothetical protein